MWEILQYVYHIFRRFTSIPGQWFVSMLWRVWQHLDHSVNHHILKFFGAIHFPKDQLKLNTTHQGVGDLPLDQQWERESSGRYRYKPVDHQRLLNESKMIDIPEFMKLLTELDQNIPIDTVDMKGARRGGRSTQSFGDKIHFLQLLLKKQRERQQRDLERWSSMSDHYKKMVEKQYHRTDQSQATRFLEAILEHHLPPPSSKEKSSSTHFLQGPSQPFHIIQDFDQIQQFYLTALEDAKDALQDMELRYPYPSLGPKLQAFCDKCVKRYYWSPFEMDAHYRSINHDLFGWNDADPFLLNLSDEEKRTYQQRLHLPEYDTGRSVSHAAYPTLPTLSMSSENDRAMRRTALLQSTSTPLSLSDQEVVRLSGVLGELLTM